MSISPSAPAGRSTNPSRAKCRCSPNRPSLNAPQPLDAGGLVAGEKETVADARDGGQVLVERILHVSQRPPVGKGEIDLPEGL